MLSEKQVFTVCNTDGTQTGHGEGNGVRMSATAGRIDDRKMVDRKIADSGRWNFHFSEIKSWCNDVWAEVSVIAAFLGIASIHDRYKGRSVSFSGPLSVVGTASRSVSSYLIICIHILIRGSRGVFEPLKEKVGEVPRCCESWGPRLVRRRCGAAGDRFVGSFLKSCSEGLGLCIDRRALSR